MSKHEETKEQAKVIRWCKEQGLEPYATAQNTWTPSWKAINENKTLGVRKGISDLIIFIPENRSTIGKTILLFIEMKKEKGGYASKEQKYFLELVNQIYGDIHGKVCNGAKEAINFIEPLILPKPYIKPTEEFINNL